MSRQQRAVSPAPGKVLTRAWVLLSPNIWLRTIWLSRRKSVMGHGRGWGRSLGKALGAVLVLILAGSVVLGSAFRRSAQKAMAQPPISPIPTSSRSSAHAKPNARAILGQLPLIFEPNQGQADSKVKFLARGAGYSLFLDPTGAVLALQTPSKSRSERSEQFVRMKLVGSNRAAATAGTDLLPGKSNYIIGNDPRQWHSGIP